MVNNPCYLTGDGVVVYNVRVSAEDVPIVLFLNEIMRRRKRRPSRLAREVGVSHATISRWLSGKDVPSIRSCRKLAEYSGVALQKILSIVGHMPGVAEAGHSEWPEFRDYAKRKYPDELDEDLITMIEDLIERRRGRRYGSGKDI